MSYKFIYFDLAGTLLHKPDLLPTIIKTLKDFGIKVSKDDLRLRHKLLSEVIKFPKKTSKEFYDYFNTELLLAIGVIPTEEIVEAVFNNCSYLQWQPFSDTRILKKIELPIGIISNWDSTLKTKLEQNFQINFRYVYESSKTVQKPNPIFFKKAFDKVKIQYDDILYVGDSIKLDIEPVLQLGAGAVLVDRYDIYPFFNGMRIRSLTEIMGIL